MSVGARLVAPANGLLPRTDVMIEYGLVAPARGRGYATEGLRGLVAHAFAQPSVRTLLADPLRDNTASHRVLEKVGFTRTHGTEDAHWYALVPSTPLGLCRAQGLYTGGPDID